MKRRDFLKQTLAGSLALPGTGLATRHVVFIAYSGARKKEYYENPSLSPNTCRLAAEGFVFEQDHCERVASHQAAFEELLREYGSKGTVGRHVDAIHKIPQMLQLYAPRLIVCRDSAHEAGHDRYESYLRAVQKTDAAIGEVWKWVKNHPCFGQNTAIVIRPDFGRDDEVNEHGSLHHSYGFYYTHRVASIFWGPDFNRGVDRTTVVNAMDMAPTLAMLLRDDATPIQGRVMPGLFRVSA